MHPRQTDQKDAVPAASDRAGKLRAVPEIATRPEVKCVNCATSIVPVSSSTPCNQFQVRQFQAAVRSCGAQRAVLVVPGAGVLVVRSPRQRDHAAVPRQQVGA